MLTFLHNFILHIKSHHGILVILNVMLEKMYLRTA